MDDIEYVGRASSQKMTSIEQDNKAAQTQYRQDTMTAALRRTTPKKPQIEELTRERFPEES
jgi:hypothetical protein